MKSEQSTKKIKIKLSKPIKKIVFENLKFSQFHLMYTCINLYVFYIYLITQLKKLFIIIVNIFLYIFIGKSTFRMYYTIALIGTIKHAMCVVLYSDH